MTEFFITKGQPGNGKERLLKAYDKLKEGNYTVRFEKGDKRSSPQNRYLHGVIIPMVFEGLRNEGWDTVRDKVDAKKVIKELFLKTKIENIHTGEVIPVQKDTHELTKEEMNVLIEEVIKWAAIYLKIQIPYPNEVLTLNI